ncbi:hypothetical protein BC829DRAFT_345983, partial [Chytridium lagenaria]
VPVLIFSDEMSGNYSKKWNLHENCFMILAGLPFEDQQRNEHLHLMCTSKSTDSIDLMDAIVENL